MAVPRKDSELVAYSTNFNTRLTDSPMTFACSQQQAEAYTAVHLPYIAAMQVLSDARAAGTHSQSQTAAKDSAKIALLDYARELYKRIQASSAVSDADKVLIGVHVPVPPSPIPAPMVSPAVDILTVVNRTVTSNIHDSASTTKRGKPAGAVGAWVYSFAGAEYPSDPSLWRFEGVATKSKFPITFPDTLAGGTSVWIRAAWVNAKGALGPLSTPVMTTLQGGGTVAQNEAIKIAA